MTGPVVVCDSVAMIRTLQKNEIDFYTNLVFADSHPLTQIRRKSLSHKFHADNAPLETVFIATDSSDQLLAALGYQTLTSQLCILGQLSCVPRCTERERDALFQTAMRHLTQTLMAKHIHTRVSIRRLDDVYSHQLKVFGFHSLGERVEYTALLDDLEIDEPTSSIRWQPVDEPLLPVAAETLKRASEGDVHGLTADENPLDVIRAYLSDPVLTRALDCIHIGFINDTPAAFVCAQVNSSDGWSRITYMGICPEFRKKGLGAAVHRHGLAMLKKQNGTVYHGGTASENKAMLRLFRKSGCQEYDRLSEFTWVAPIPIV